MTTTPPRPSRRRRPRPTPLTGDVCPLLATGVAFEEAPDGAVWIALIHGVPSSRTSRAVVDLLSAMDGSTSLDALRRRFAATESPESFLRLIARFRDSGLLAGCAKLPPGRVTFRPPLTLQLATLRAPAVFDRLDRLIVPVSPRVLLLSLAVLLGIGAIAAALQARELARVFTTPVPLVGVLVVIAALSFTTLLHEGAHGLTLTRFGGRPRRAGFMLFYLTPAFFVDVTDGWRLPNRRQRVAIALAGPAVHASVAATALIVALVLPDPAARRTLLLLALSCAVIVLINLIPFVRFDGYIALMSALDEPNLRLRTIRDGASFLTRALFGGPRATKSVSAWWSVPFGLASLLAPVVLVSYAVTRTAQALAGGGPALGLLVVLLEAVVILVGLAILLRALGRVLRSGVSRLRFLAVVTALVAGVAIAGSLLPVPVTAAFGFVSDGDRVLLVRTVDDAEARVRDGVPVVLMSRGILASEVLGEGEAHSLRPQATTVPLEALFPATAAGVSVPAVIVAEVDVPKSGRSLPSTGQARIEVSRGNLWETLWETGVVSPLSPLLGQNEEGTKWPIMQ